MKNYKVKVTCGLYDAPMIILQANSDKEAEEIARERSGLSRFPNWAFTPREYIIHRNSNIRN